MRIVGICASVLAAAQFMILSTPAIAAPADPADKGAATTPAEKKPAKAGRKKPKKTDAVADGSSPAPTAAPTTGKKPRGRKPKKGEAAAAAAAPEPTPVAPAPVVAPATTPVGTTSLTSADVPATPATDDKPTPGADAKPEAKTDAKAEAKTDTKQEDGMVDVHIDSPSAVTLEKRSAESTWQKACESPCDTKLGVSDEYRMVGTDLNASLPFRLDGSKSKVVLKVSPGTPGGQTRGLVTTIAGGAVLVGGIAVILVGVKHHGNADGELSQPSNDGALLAGGAMVFAGIVGGILGSAWLVNNAHTGVEGDVGKPSSGTASRQPTYGTPKQVGMPAFTSVPVLSGTF